jgi:uncharacterized membrane protein YfcA
MDTLEKVWHHVITGEPTVWAGIIGVLGALIGGWIGGRIRGRLAVLTFAFWNC